MTVKKFTPEIIEYINTYIRYDKEEGKLYWKLNPHPLSKDKIGKECGDIYPNGYKRVGILGTKMLHHRIIYFLENGVCPPILDHKDGNTLNNTISNLRACTISLNMANSKNNGKYKKGVYKQKNRYFAQIQYQGKHIKLGCFKSEDEAHEAYKEAAIKYFGEFARFE